MALTSQAGIPICFTFNADFLNASDLAGLLFREGHGCFVRRF
jgi:hypothetical protein